MTTKYYIGVEKDGKTRHVWSASCHIVTGWKYEPDWKKQYPTIKKQYIGVIGPFKTREGAEYTSKHFENNPDIWNCAEADAKAASLLKAKKTKKNIVKKSKREGVREIVVKTPKGTALVVYTIGEKVHFCPHSRYNPRIVNARDPTFDGTFEEAVNYAQRSYPW